MEEGRAHSEFWANVIVTRALQAAPNGHMVPIFHQGRFEEAVRAVADDLDVIKSTVRRDAMAEVKS